MYRALDSVKIVETLDQLEARIGERFPDSSLAKICGELAEIARENKARVERIARPNIALRLLSAAIVAGGVALLLYVASIVKVAQANTELFGMLQGIEASVNLLIVMGAAALFLATLERRFKRRQALEDLHELRAIIHVIDMHQLTKDPITGVAGAGPSTPSSPKRTLSPFLLTRYLDYCSEMYSLAGKVAALYAQSSDDTVVIEVVNDLERLTTNLSQKVWQKITMVSAAVAEAERKEQARAAGAPVERLSAAAAAGGLAPNPAEPAAT